MSKTAVTSFIIRFKQEESASETPLPWRGLIRHVQTSQEQYFTTLAEAVKFMGDFVEIEPIVETAPKNEL